jgi:glycosyltransferase involved in cell wall biosynthesis
VDGDRWTGPAAVVFDHTASLIAAGVEAQFAFLDSGPLAERLRTLGWARPLLRRPKGPAGYAAEVRRLRETLERERFDLVHAHRSYDHTLAMIAAAGTGIRLARTLHHVRHARPDPVTRLVFRRTDAFAYANREIASRFGRPGPVLPPVVDVERFRPGVRSEEVRSRFGLPRGGFSVGTVGKLSAGRGHAEAIEALAGLPPSARLVHVGHGEHSEDLKRFARERGVAERNFWIGYQEEALPDLFRLWDVFLFTASGSDQGQRAILEAMASGVPVVALDLPGVRDLVTDGAEGFVVADTRGLPATLARLAGDETLRRAMGERARTRSLDFAPKRFVERVLPFYAEVLARRAEAATVSGREATAPRGLPSDVPPATPSDTPARSGRPDR